MSDNDPVRRVSVVSTGQVQIRPDYEASTWRPVAWWLLASRRWTGPRPINAYTIEHRDGLVLFDTGQDRASVTDPGYFPRGMTGVLHGRLALSHPHQDHIGGLAEPGEADILVSQAEWDTLPAGPLGGQLRRGHDRPDLRHPEPRPGGQPGPLTRLLPRRHHRDHPRDQRDPDRAPARAGQH